MPSLRPPVDTAIFDRVQEANPIIASHSADASSADTTGSWPRFLLQVDFAGLPELDWPSLSTGSAVPRALSCDIYSADGQRRRRMFLDTCGHSQLSDVAKWLVTVVGDHGPVFTSHPARLRAQIRALADAVPQANARLFAVGDRLCAGRLMSDVISLVSDDVDEAPVGE